MWESPEPKKGYDMIIIGGGGHGLGTAYYLAKEHNPKRFTEGYTSIRTLTDFNKHDVVIFNGHYETMLKRGWWHEYTINPKPWWNDIDK